MNIYHCNRTLLGFNLEAVVICKHPSDAFELLRWEIDEDTTEIDIKLIGTSFSETPQVVCEEVL